MSSDAAETLRNHYVNIRARVAKTKKEVGDAPIPITVRQLEAITRISESLARIELQEQGLSLIGWRPLHIPQLILCCVFFCVSANSGHIAEAIRLFKFSTLQAASTGAIAQGQGSADFRKHVQSAEDFIRARLPINHRAPRRQLLEQYLSALKTDSMAPFAKALDIMRSRGDLSLENQNRTVVRLR